MTQKPLAASCGRSKDFPARLAHPAVWHAAPAIGTSRQGSFVAESVAVEHLQIEASADVLPEEKIQQAFDEEDANFAQDKDDIYTPPQQPRRFIIDLFASMSD